MSTDDENELAPRHRRKMLKSGMDSTGATTILKKITWPHEVVYASAGKPASYQDMSVHQFVYGFFLVMDSEEVDIKVQMT